MELGVDLPSFAKRELADLPLQLLDALVDLRLVARAAAMSAMSSLWAAAARAMESAADRDAAFHLTGGGRVGFQPVHTSPALCIAAWRVGWAGGRAPLQKPRSVAVGMRVWILGSDTFRIRRISPPSDGPFTSREARSADDSAITRT